MKQTDIHFKELSKEETQAILPPNLILLGFRGSIAHGTYVASTDPNSIDDKDIMGVYIAPKEHYLGFGKRDVYEKFYNMYDCVFYEVRKFVSLLLKSNPNVLGLLWLSPQYYIYKTEEGQLLIDNRELFVSKQAFLSFNGYAWGQFHRMTHYKFEGYMGEKRKQLVDKYGYDIKNAVHLIRLLEMGIEYLTEGKLYVERSNATKLLSIKQGEWTLEEVKKEAERLFTLTQEAYIKSPLPAEPKRNEAEQLVMKIIRNNLFFD